MSHSHHTILRRAETLRRTGLTSSTLYELQAKGKFPKPIKLTGQGRSNATGWLESEVNQWIESRLSERDS